MKSRWFFALAAILGLSLFSGLSVPVAAATPTVKLVLGGTGALPWAIGGVAPGNSGTNLVSVSNIGYKDGSVTIWVSDIVNGEGANPESETGDTAEPGELGNHLLLNVSGASLSANFPLPAVISDLPQSIADAGRIFITPLKAFSTLNMQWDWQLPAGTGNDVQGDTLSFTINYALEELPSLPLPPGGGGEPQAISKVVIKKTGPSGVFTGFTRNYTLSVTNTGAVTLNDVTVTDYLPALMSHKSSIPSGTVTGSQISWNLGSLNIGETKSIVTILGGVKAGLAVNTATVTTREGATSTDSLNITILGAPGAHMSLIDSSDPVAVCDVYTYTIKVLNQSTGNSLHNMTIVGLIPAETAYVGADGPVTFTVVGSEIRFGPVAELKPGDTVEFHIQVRATSAGAAIFNAAMRWDEFGEPIIGQEGTTIFLAEPSAPSPTTSVPETNTPALSTNPVPGALAPFPSMTPLPVEPASLPPAVAASFEVRNLTVKKDQINPGESISINCEVINTSGQSGEFTLRIDIPGLLQTSRLIRLDAGQTQVVSLTLPLPAGNPGTYQVNIGGAKDTFSIGTSVPTLLTPTTVQKAESPWWIPAILAAIAAAMVILCVIIIAMIRRRSRRNLRHSRSTGVRVSGLSSEQQALYAINRRRRMAILAAAFAREKNSKHRTIGRKQSGGRIERL